MSNFVGVNKDYRKVLQLTEEALNVLYGTGYAISETENTEVVQNESRNNADTKW